MNSVSFFILLSLATSTIVSRSAPKATRRIAMTEVYPNSRLNATSTDPSSAKDRKNCAIKCLWNPFCKSFDFCGRKLCLVHDEDVYTIVLFNDSSALVEDDNCVHVGMERESKPECVARTVAIQIQDDTTFGSRLCEINQKRQDCEWTEWSEDKRYVNNTVWNSSIVNPMNREFKRYQEREIIRDQSHGGKECMDGPEKLFEWFVFLPVRNNFLNWDQAKATCESFGWKLFGNINGSLEEVSLLCHMLGANNLWLAVTDEAQEGVWLNEQDVNLRTVIPWRQNGEPNGGRAQNHLNLNCDRWTYEDNNARHWYEDRESSQRGAVTCDLNSP
ncbi:uncharacterized protein LOC142354503 isoform X1 [Convolutriloba macropyga]|uniref:uncharacterized protein LOC142354503 isoform X1 n=1 Tax=Convolutriloba macropyga TaxID=536237 RepID=UPI003F5256AF